MGEGVLFGVDAGGTTFKCAVADAAGRILARRRVETGLDPDKAVNAACAFAREHANGVPISGVGLAAFGPLNLDPGSPDFGAIQKTPKPGGWSQYPLRAAFAGQLNAPVFIDTDVNAALRAEMQKGAAQSSSADPVQTAVYFTIGTGIGAGFFARGGFLGRPSHPEFGHIAVRRAPGDEGFTSVCPFHGDCLEGFASATALSARFGDLAALADGHPGWDLVADYLAQACRAAFLAVRPERIVLGGGVMLRDGLLGRVRTAWAGMMGGYLDFNEATARRIAVRAGLGDEAGLMGALLLAMGDGRALG